MVEYLPWAMVRLGLLLLMLLCATGLGNVVLRKCQFHNFAERLVFTIALGLGLCSLLLFSLGLFGILYGPLIWVLTISGSVATVVGAIYSHRGWLRIRPWKQLFDVRHSKERHTLQNAVIALLIFLAISCSLMVLVQSQYPPTNWDSISNHLVIARTNLAEHKIVVVRGIPVPVLPLLNHMFFTWAMAMKDDVLAQMVVCTFFVLIALGLYAWGQRQNHPAMGATAAALWLAHPLVREQATTAYVDIGLTCFVFLGVYALRLFWDSRSRSWWYLGNALLAMAAGTKITGFFFVGLGGIVGLAALLLPWLRTFKLRGEKKDHANISSPPSPFSWKSLALGLVLALLIAAPWYAFNIANPLRPFVAAYGTGGSVSPLPIDARNWLDPLMGLKQATLKNFFMVYIDFFRDPVRFNAAYNLTLSPLIVFWPLAWIVAVFNRSVRWWVFWILSFTVFWFLTVPFIRYWFPVLPMAGLALCEAIQWILGKVRRSTALHNAIWVVATVVILVWTGYSLALEINAKSLPPASPEAREAYLTRLHGYQGVKYVNARADKGDTVCVLGAIWLNYYFGPRVFDESGSPKFRWPDDRLWIEWLDSENVKWIVINPHEYAIPNQNPVINPFWPDYQIVFADSRIWVFQRKPVQ